jgi:hypothetical protein
MIPPAELPDLIYIAMSTSPADHCATAFVGGVYTSGDFRYPTGSLISISGLRACYASTTDSFRVSSVCHLQTAYCGTFALEALPASPPPAPPPVTNAQCTSFSPPTGRAVAPIAALPSSTYVFARSSDCPTSCGVHCEVGCLFCSVRGK